jgi:hypothetical protein
VAIVAPSVHPWADRANRRPFPLAALLPLIERVDSDLLLNRRRRVGFRP